MNSKMIAVIEREFVARVYTKTFVITTILLPVVILIFAVAPVLLMGQSDQTTRIAVVDGTGGPLGQQVARVLSAEKRDTDAGPKPRYQIKLVPARGRVASVRQKLLAETGFSHDDSRDRFDGVLVLDEDVLTSGTPTYYGINVSSIKTMAHLQNSLTKAFAATRLANAGIDVRAVGKAMRPVDMSATGVSDGQVTGKSAQASFIVAYGMGFLLYLAVVLFGQQTMASVIEEKTTRIMEVLVSSMTPFQMLMGKVLGVGAAGLLQMAIWGVSAWLISTHVAQLAALFGVDPSTVSAFALPSIRGSLIVVFLLFFALGFLLYGALYAAIGSMCNSQRETSQYAVVIRMLAVIGFLGVFAIIANPTGQLAGVMPWIPFFAPFTMPVLWSLTSVSTGYLVGSLVLMVTCILVCVWLAARVYRIGILMYGKKPSWREVWRWVLAS